MAKIKITGKMSEKQLQKQLDNIQKEEKRLALLNKANAAKEKLAKMKK